VYVLRGADTAGIASAGDSRVVVAEDLDSLRSAIDVASVEQARARAESSGANGHADTRQAIVLAPDSANADEKRLLEGLSTHAARVTVIYLRRDAHPAAVIELDGDKTTTNAPDVVLDGAASATAPSVPKVSLQLLGAYRIVVDGREVTSGLRSKARELLAYLAVNREGATADAAIDVLLPDYEPDKGQAYFRTIVGNVRTVLRTATGASEDTAFISRVGSRYRLDPETIDVDIWAFEDATQAAEGRHDGASALYRGPFVDGEDYTWAEHIRERIRQRAIDHFVREAERRRDAGELDAAIHAAERAVECDPYAEELYARVIALQEALGRPDAARRTQEAMTRRLAEIGIEPSAKQQQLAE
jgi:DNA-binding SARP family transcriptional activator